MKILVVSPHPDDETLGAGGTLLKAKEAGNSISWLNITNMKREYGYAESRIEERMQEISEVKEAYGMDEFIDLGLEPANLDKYDTGDMVVMLKNSLETIRPDILIAPYRYDVHSDHRIVYDALYSCTKSFRAPYIKAVLSMEILSETDQAQHESAFSPNVFVDISEYVDRKIAIMHKYASEIQPIPFPRNDDAIRGLAAYRGATSNFQYSEGFYLIKSRIE